MKLISYTFLDAYYYAYKTLNSIFKRLLWIWVSSVFTFKIRYIKYCIYLHLSVFHSSPVRINSSSLSVLLFCTFHFSGFWCRRVVQCWHGWFDTSRRIRECLSPSHGRRVNLRSLLAQISRLIWIWLNQLLIPFKQDLFCHWEDKQPEIRGHRHSSPVWSLHSCAFTANINITCWN